MNQVTILGRSGANAEVKYAQNGTAIVNLSIATSEKQGETWVSTWHKVVVFGKTAENIATVCFKGSEVFVYGKIVNRKWTDKNGQEKHSQEIIANWIRVCESGRPKQQQQGYGGPDEENPENYRPNQTTRTPPPARQPSPAPMSEDDIPF
jgi:single-strand DNA-binding protein